jgi:hypothetical protein
MEVRATGYWRMKVRGEKREVRGVVFRYPLSSYLSPLFTSHLSPLLTAVMPEARVELARGCPRRILSPLRLPFRHSGRLEE